MVKEVTDKKASLSNALLFEVAWEVCNQVGGIYTVIRSKIPAVLSKIKKENYFLIGPWIESQALPVFEPIEDLTDPIGFVVHIMRESGYDVNYGFWLVSGKPRVILFNTAKMPISLADIKFALWNEHYISTPNSDALLDEVVSFGHQVKEFFRLLITSDVGSKTILAHFHEWMAGLPIPGLRKLNLPIKIIFTTHATLLGRYLAMNDDNFYGNLPYYNWEIEAKKFNVMAIAQIERACAHGSHVFSTVSDITAKECTHLLGRTPDIILPNGLNIERFEAMHKFQNLHIQYKEQIHEFVMGHFFQSYSFDLNNTLYFFSSGRYEYHNKGYDITLEALARLNYKMKLEKLDTTVVFFLVTRQPTYTFNPLVLQSKALMEEIRRNTSEIQDMVGRKLFYKITSDNGTFQFPALNDMVEEHARLKLRRNVQTWKTKKLPFVVTHNLVNDSTDEVLHFLRVANLINHRDDKVKIVYHPDFINSANPLFHMEYNQFVRGCHLGVFPSYYEPWGYTPLECMASGVPSITSDLAGFGSYVQKNIENCEKFGLYIIERHNKSFNEAAEELANKMLTFAKLSRRDRINLRNNTESESVQFDWNNLTKYYIEAYNRVL